MPEPPVIQLAGEVHDIARQVIIEHHPHLLGAKVLCLFTDQTRKKCDRVRLGSASTMNALQRFLASNMESSSGGFDFVMMIDSNEWPGLSPAQREALVDHECCHMMVFLKGETGWRRIQDGQSKDDFLTWRYGLVSHDVEEFSAIIKRHGWWKKDATETEFADAARQLTLPGMQILAQSRN